MKKKKLIIIVSLALILIVAAAAVLIFGSETVTASGTNLNVEVRGIKKGSATITVTGTFPEAYDIQAVSTSYLDITETENGQINYNALDFLELTEITRSAVEAEFKAVALASGSGSAEIYISKDGNVQSKVYVDFEVSEKNKFTECKIFFDEEPEVTEITLGNTYQAELRHISNGIELLISSKYSSWAYDPYDKNYILTTYFEDVQDKEYDYITRLVVQVNNEGCFNYVFSNNAEGKQVFLDLKSEKQVDERYGNVSYRVDILNSWCEDFELFVMPESELPNPDDIGKDIDLLIH